MIRGPWPSIDASGGPWNVLVITMDTTRRDHLGCYGFDRGDITPNLDRLAASGIVFEDGTTPIPVTLPSHATVFTGLDPSEHGVHNNGTFVLEDRHETLAEVLRAEGYATGASPASIPVEGRFGLAQGFDVYDDDFPEPETQYEAEQRTATEITEVALGWIRQTVESDRNRPFFHWAHYFDPHFPYEPPEPFRSRFPSPYEGEISYMDAEIGRLLEGLDALGVRDKTWIVVVADHGESLGAHAEDYHSMFIYAVTQDIPFIVVPPVGWNGLDASLVRGTRVGGVVRLKDVAPTLLHGLGLGEDRSIGTGSSLLTMVDGTWEGPKIAYQETIVPFLEYGWCELRGVRTLDFSYIRAPEREVYDLRKDPAEEENLHESFPTLAEKLEAWTAFFTGDETDLSPQDLDQETVEQLRSLGYIGSAAPQGSPVNDMDPKELMPLFGVIGEARTALSAQNPTAARRLLESVLRKDPKNPEANRLYGATLIRVGEPAMAVKAYERLRERYPDDPQVVTDMAYASLMANDVRGALDYLKQAVELDPTHSGANDLYPRVLAQSGDIAGGRRFLETRVAEAKDVTARQKARTMLMQYLWQVGEREAAVQNAEEMLGEDPSAAAAHTLLGLKAWEEGMQSLSAGSSGPAAFQSPLFREARERWERALELDPDDGMAASQLATLYTRTGQSYQAIEMHRTALRINPENPVTHAELGKLLQQTNRAAEAIPHYQFAYASGYAEPVYMTNYGLALAGTGDRAQARAVLERALTLGPSPNLAATIQRNLQILGSQ